MKLKIAVIVLIPIIIVASFVAWMLSSINESVPITESKQVETIVAFGDSLVEGTGSTDGHDFVSVLSQKIGTTIVNEGKRGDTTSQALSRIDTIIAWHPDVVLVLFGGNDALQKVPQAVTFDNLDAILKRLTDEKIAVVLLGIQGGIFSDPYAAEFERLARQYNIEYVPNVLEGLVGNQSLMSDAVHPNDDGYLQIANKIYPVLKPLIGK